MPEGPHMLFDTTFVNPCHLWAIMRELAVLYCKDPEAPLFKQYTTSFAECKYREIMNRSAKLSIPAEDHQGELYRRLILR